MAQVFDMNNYKIKGSHEISVLVVSVLQPVIAGGLSKERAKEIFEEIMSNITSLGKDKDGRTAFQTLLDDILKKWYPMALKDNDFK
ncbi:MAG: hypothetical protein ABFD08_13380 [Syntrophomonas sp.]